MSTLRDSLGRDETVGHGHTRHFRGSLHNEGVAAGADIRHVGLDRHVRHDLRTVDDTKLMDLPIGCSPHLEAASPSYLPHFPRQQDIRRRKVLVKASRHRSHRFGTQVFATQWPVHYQATGA